MKHFFQLFSLASLLLVMPLAELTASAGGRLPFAPPALRFDVREVDCPAPLKTNFCPLRGESECGDEKLQILKKLSLQTTLNKELKPWCPRVS